MTVPMQDPYLTPCKPMDKPISKYLAFRESLKDVLNWSVDQVTAWVSHLRFSTKIINAFSEARVDGDILLQIEESNLKDDLQMINGIDRKRFLRELNKLKKAADYSSMDSNNINNFLEENLGEEYKVYTYNLISHDFSVGLAKRLSATDLHDTLKEAGVNNSIHRCKIIEAVETMECKEDSSDESMTSSSLSLIETSSNLTYEQMYISYTKSRSSSELASLVSMQMQMRGFSVHSADTQGSQERALDSIRTAKNFVIVLTPGSLDKPGTFLMREIVTALQSGCNVVPVVEDFKFPEPETLPEEIRPICGFNAVRWIHDYQNACIDKLEKFLKGEAWYYGSQATLNRSGRRQSGGSGRSGSCTPAKSIHLSPVLSSKHRRIRTISSDSALGC